MHAAALHAITGADFRAPPAKSRACRGLEASGQSAVTWL
jgi:hypothetical protein